MTWTRRELLNRWLGISVFGIALHSFWRPITIAWSNVRKVLPKGFSKEELKNMNPAEVDSRNLEVDPLDKFGTMGPTEVVIDSRTYRLKIGGKVEKSLALTYEQILKQSPVTETILLICPGFFTNNGRWTGVSLKSLLREAQVKMGAEYVDVRGAQEKVVRIPLRELDQKRILLAHHVNGEPLPRKHGFPLRLVYEDAYGSDWVKYVDELTVS